MIKFEVDGLEKMERKLEASSMNTEDKNIRFNELFPPQFIQNYTQFNTLDEMFKESNFKIEFQKDFKMISKTKWDEFVKNNTEFADWEEMVYKAGKEWTKKEL